MDIEEIKQYSHKIVKIDITNDNDAGSSSEDYVTIKIHLNKKDNETIRFSKTKNPSGSEWYQHQSLGNDYFLRIENKTKTITYVCAHFFPDALYKYVEPNDIVSVYDFSDFVKNKTENQWDKSEYPLQITSYGYEMLLGYENKPLIRSLLKNSVTRYKDPNYKNYTETDIASQINMTEKGRFPLSSRYRNSLYRMAPKLNDDETFKLPYWQNENTQYSNGANPVSYSPNLTEDGYIYDDDTATESNNDNECEKRTKAIPYWEAKIHRTGLSPWLNDTPEDATNYTPINVYLNYQYLPTSTEYHQHYYGFERKNIRDQNGNAVNDTMLKAVESYYPNGKYNEKQSEANKEIMSEYCEKIKNGTYKQVTNNNDYEVLDGEELHHINQGFGTENKTYRLIRHGNPFDNDSSIYVNHKKIYDVNLMNVGIKKNCLWNKNNCQNYYTYTPTGKESSAYIDVTLNAYTYYVLKYFMYIPAGAYIEDDSCYIEIQSQVDGVSQVIGELNDDFKKQDKKLRHQWIYHEIPFYTYDDVNKIIIKGPQHNYDNIIGIKRSTGEVIDNYHDDTIVPIIDETVSEYINELTIDLDDDIEINDETLNAFTIVSENIINTVVSRINDETTLTIKEQDITKIINSFITQVLDNIKSALNDEAIANLINQTIIELIYKYSEDPDIELHDCRNDVIHFYSIQIAEMVEYSPTIKYTKTGMYIVEEDKYAKKSLTDARNKTCADNIISTTKWISEKEELPIPATDVYIFFDNDFTIIYNKFTTELSYTKGDSPFLFNDFNKNFDETLSWISNDAVINLQYDRATTPENTAQSNQQQTNRTENDLDISELFLGELKIFNTQRQYFTRGVNNSFSLRLQDAYGNGISSGEVECSIWTSNKEENTPCEEAERCLGTQTPDEYGIIKYEKLNFKNFKPSNETYYLRVKYRNNCYNREITKWKTLIFVEEYRNMEVFANTTNNQVCINQQNNKCKLISSSIFKDSEYEKISYPYLIKSVDEYPLRLDVKIRSQKLNNNDGNIIDEGYCELYVNDKFIQTTFVDSNGIADFYLDEADLDPGIQVIRIEYCTKPHETINYVYFIINCSTQDGYDERPAIPIKINKLTKESVTELSNGVYEIEKDNIFFADIDINDETNFSITVERNGVKEIRNIVDKLDAHTIAAIYQGNDCDKYIITTGNPKDEITGKDISNKYRTTKKSFCCQWIDPQPRTFSLNGFIKKVELNDNGNLEVTMFTENDTLQEGTEKEIIKDVVMVNENLYVQTTIVREESDLAGLIREILLNNEGNIVTS